MIELNTKEWQLQRWHCSILSTQDMQLGIQESETWRPTGTKCCNITSRGRRHSRHSIEICNRESDWQVLSLVSEQNFSGSLGQLPGWSTVPEPYTTSRGANSSLQNELMCCVKPKTYVVDQADWYEHAHSSLIHVIQRWTWNAFVRISCRVHFRTAMANLYYFLEYERFNSYIVCQLTTNHFFCASADWTFNTKLSRLIGLIFFILTAAFAAL